jgi:hypothetical protein
MRDAFFHKKPPRLPTHRMSLILAGSISLASTFKKGIQSFCLSQTTSHRVHRVATAAFWRTFSHEGKISPGW